MKTRSGDDNPARRDATPGDRRSGRQRELERLERDSFILLQHVYTVTGADPAVPVNGARIGSDLGFAPKEASRLIHFLNWLGYMRESASDPHLSLAEEGIEYLEVRAGRRRSVRAAADEPLPLPICLD